MADVKWIKITTDMFDDEKIRLIESMPDSDAILIIWVKLLAQAGKCNATGHLILSEKIPYTDEMLSTIFNRPLNTVRMALETFKSFGMIEYNELIKISNWEKYQNIEGLEKIKEQNRLRKQKQREKEKQKQLMSQDMSRDVTQQNKNKNIDIDIEKDKKEKSKKTKKFTKPTLDQVNEYLKEINSTIDAEKWYDYYESNGWKVSKNSMKDWKACCRNWTRNENKKSAPISRGQENGKTQVQQESDDYINQIINGG